jgi:glyoxylase-like metal-dependent hydrolase (beta-lactamase superfamily II)
MNRRLTIVLAMLLAVPAMARAADSLGVHKVAEGIYALVGDLGQRSPGNLGNNATFGAVITAEGVVLVDSGGSAKGAEAIETALRTITAKPVIAVINTGGQDHRWLGNAYFKAQGARLIAPAAAVKDQRGRSDMQIQVMRAMVGDTGFGGTEPAFADDVFDRSKEMLIGGLRFVLMAAPHAHTPGDSLVWLPESGTVFAGDIAVVERMLGVLEVSRSKSWIAAFDMMAELSPRHVVPGHGSPTTLAEARRDTRDYLSHLRAEVGTILQSGKDVDSAAGIDQSAFLHLRNSDQLARRNAMQVFLEMEFE